MKKVIVMSIALAVVIGLTGCGKKAGSPAEVLTLMQQCKSEEEAKAYFTKGTIKALDELKKLMPNAKTDKNQKNVQEGDKWDVVKEEINGDTATLTIKYTGSKDPKKVGKTVTMKMKKEDGSWKIDMEAELNAGLQLMKGLKGLDINKMMQDALKKGK